MSNMLNLLIEICDKQIITHSFGYSSQYQPSTILAKALRLIMGSHIDASGDNQNSVL